MFRHQLFVAPYHSTGGRTTDNAKPKLPEITTPPDLVVPLGPN